MKKFTTHVAGAALALGLVMPATLSTAQALTPAPAAVAAQAHVAEKGGFKAGEPVIEVNAQNLEQTKTIAKERPVVFLVTAPAWCSACQQLDPIIHKIAKEDGGKWLLAVIDVDKAGGAEKEFGVKGYPTMVPWGKDGELTAAGQGGPGDEATVRAWIDGVVKAYGPVDPNPAPTPNPTTDPTPAPTADPTSTPTADPTADPTPAPTEEPTTDPTATPTADPTTDPTPQPQPDEDDGDQDWWQGFLDWINNLLDWN